MSPEKLKKIFEKEYRARGYSKERADSIFYGYESKHGKRYGRRKSRLTNIHPMLKHTAGRGF